MTEQQYTTDLPISAILHMKLPPSARLLLVALAAEGPLSIKAAATISGISPRNLRRIAPLISQHLSTTTARKTPQPVPETTKSARPPKAAQLAAIKAALPSLQKQFPDINVPFEHAKWLDWLAATNRRFANYQAAFRNWLRRAKPTTQKTFMHYLKQGAAQ